MRIQVLGSGCPTCKKLYETTKQAAEELELVDEVEYITDVQTLLEMGVMSSPVLAIDGRPVIVGSVPGITNIKNVIEENRTK